MIMKPKSPKIGLVGVMSTPFRGDKQRYYQQHREAVETLSRVWDFEFHAVSDGVYNTAQAQQAARELQDWGADFVLLQTSSFASGNFLYPLADLDARLGLWAVPEGPPSEEGGLPLNSFTAANMYNSILKQYLTGYQKPVKWFFGNPGQRYFDERLKLTVQALRVLINLPGTRIALIGGVAPSFDNVRVDERILLEKLGIKILHLELDEVLQKAQSFSLQDIKEEMEAIQTTAASLDDRFQPMLEKTARVSWALQEMASEFEFDATALSCWPKFQSDYQLAVCSVMGRLNSQGLIAACEGDIPSAVSMLTLHLLTGGDIVTLMDLVTIDPNDDSVLLWHCGPTPPALADEKGVTMEPLWLFDGEDGSQIGLHNDLVLKPGPATILGFTPNFDHMLILEGQIDNQKPSYKGSRGWFRELHMHGNGITAPELVQTLMRSGYQHHYPLSYGSLGRAAQEVCGWLGIAPIEIQAYTDYLVP